MRRRANRSALSKTALGLVWTLIASSASITATAAAQGGESLSVARPFEVGPSLSGNYLAAIVAHSERDTLAASTFFREAQRGDPNNRELTERALIAALANGNMPDAYAYASAVLAHDRSNGVAHLTRGVEAMVAKKYPAARAEFAKDAAPQQPDVKNILLTAWTYAGQKQTKRALSTLDKLNGEGFSVLRDYHAALIADIAGDRAEADKRFKRMLGADRTVLRLVDAYARFLSSHGENESARRLYEAYDAAAPNHPIVVAALAELNAGKTLEPFVRNAEEGAGEVLYGLVSLGGRQADELAALIYLRLSLALAPGNTLAIFTLADIYERLKQVETAIDLYDSVPESSPLRINADVQAALLLETLGKSKEASEHLQTVVEAHPKDADALTALANLQRSRKLFAESAATYSRALALQQNPEKSQWLLYYYRGIANERRKDWPDAEKDLKKALELNPDQPLVLNYLGYSWVDQGVNLDEAFRMLRRAVDLKNRDGYIVDSLGWAYYRLGRYDEAVVELEKAIDLKPSDPVINDHLGDAYWRVGRKLEAQFQWNHARDLGPEPEDLPRILDKIKNGLADKPAVAGEKAKSSGG
ncbi:tetratricopeptide repeat protein [Methylocystis heyeri]|uniref:Tetratricopeptide repeat protein n=1 Tax=Methylocystis heyeri TaxID=391905 RepID=A0A6B8KH94_9HYPH|nr:tetratricopeptide repeat protein [Methylocystis heyeri]QGM46361.1 tetratricopeptide repeat protein [Methylocystis heyeri]